jgi:uncharacterized protein
MHSIRENFGASRFEAYVDGSVAGSLHYRVQDGQLWLLRVVIDPEYRGPDLGAPLVRYALAQAHRRRLAVLPFCIEARRQVFAHPVYLKLVPPAEHKRFSKSLGAQGGTRAARTVRTGAGGPARTAEAMAL